MQSLQDRLDRYKGESRAKQNPATTAALEAAIAELRISHPAGSYVQAGDVFPDFSLPDSTGATFSLQTQLIAGPLVLSFYRGLWCPYCNLELEALAEIHGELRRLGAELVVISPQSAASSIRVSQRRNLPFRMLVDAGNRVAASAGLKYRLSEPTVHLYQSLGVNLPTFNGDDTWTLPIPARVIVTQDGRVHSIHADPDYTRRPEPVSTLRAIEELTRALPRR